MKKPPDDDPGIRLREALRLLLEKCPFLTETCYWAGTAAIAVEELGHRQSFDLDFHTRRALLDVRPILARIRAAFAKDFELIHAPDEFGSGFLGLLTMPDGERIAIEVLSNYEDAPEADLVPSATAANLLRVSLSRYLADKIQCVAEGMEARDLYDVFAVLEARPALAPRARSLLAEQDALLIGERLLAWSDAEIERDLRAYPGVDPEGAKNARDRLLAWLREDAADGGA